MGLKDVPVVSIKNILAAYCKHSGIYRVSPLAHYSSNLHIRNAIGYGKCVGMSCYKLRGMKGLHVLIFNVHKYNQKRTHLIGSVSQISCC